MPFHLRGTRHTKAWCSTCAAARVDGRSLNGCWRILLDRPFSLVTGRSQDHQPRRPTYSDSALMDGGSFSATAMVLASWAARAGPSSARRWQTGR